MKSLRVLLPLWLLLSLCVACSDDDDDAKPDIDDDDDDIHADDDDDDDDLDPFADSTLDAFIECTATCPGQQICVGPRDCFEPTYPELQPDARDIPSIDGEANLLINGRRIQPAGPSILLGTFPTHLAVSPDGKMLVANETGKGYRQADGKRRHVLRVVDTDSMTLVQELTMPNGSMHNGVLFNQAGDRLYVSGAGDGEVHVYRVTAEHRLELDRSIPLGEKCFVSGLVMSPDESRLYVTCVVENAAFAIELADDSIAGPWDAGSRPYTAVVSNDGGRLFLSNWSTLPRPEGDTVTVLDTATGQQLGAPLVGLAPEAIFLSPDGSKVYSIGSNSDDVWVIDADTLVSSRLLSLHEDPEAPKGIQPSLGAMSPDGSTLYIASNNENAILVIDLIEPKFKGMIPAEWYASSAALSADGATLYGLSARGRGDGTNKETREDTGNLITGTVFKIDVPDEAQLADWTAETVANNQRPMSFFDASSNDGPIPSEYGQPSDKIKYVFWIMKENMSYDAVFGSLDIGNGDPELQFWDDDQIPNHQALAREFAMLDNFYNESDNSVTGHTWLSVSALPDWAQKAQQLDTSNTELPYPTPGFDAGALPENEAVIPHLLEQGIWARSYGVGEQFGPGAIGKYADAYNVDYPLVATAAYSLLDRDKAGIFIEEFNRFIEEGEVPQFSFISLPNDHGQGLEIGVPTPKSMIADNDEGLGLVIEAIANSPIWKQSVIFVFEDDTQYGFDHVDAHRGPCIVISPWVQRGLVSSALYSYPNLFKTMTLILGSKPLTRWDLKATPMYDLFTSKPDLTPYDRIPRIYPHETYQGEANALVRMSRRMNWDNIDLGKDVAELYWSYAKGTVPPRHLWEDEPFPFEAGE